MKRLDLLTVSTLAAALLWTGPAFSADSTGTAPNATRETSAPPAPKPSTFAMPHSLTGSVVSVNSRAQMFRVKASDGKTVLLRADSETAPQLRDLKPGAHVKVNYKNSGGDKVATKITPS